MRKVFNRRVRREEDGLNLAADINAVVAVTEGERGKNAVSSKTRTRVVQRSKRSGSPRTNKEER
jgi:hypothetical protein